MSCSSLCTSQRFAVFTTIKLTRHRWLHCYTSTNKIFRHLLMTLVWIPYYRLKTFLPILRKEKYLNFGRNEESD